MEAKQRVSYRAFVEQQDAKKREGTVAALIERYIVEMNGLNGQPPVKELGQSHLIILRCLQRAAIGAKDARTLDRKDVIAHCQERRKKVQPATINQDVVYLSGALKYAGSAWDDCDGISDAAVAAARPFLLKHNLTGKSNPRKRRPNEEEISRLLEHFDLENKRPLNEIDMVKVTRWQIASSRRISETCRIEWADWDRETHTMMVHKMKDPKNRNKTKMVALPDAAQAMLIDLWETRDPNEPRIFPYKSKSCSARYTMAKRALGIKDLRLHDSRRECFTRLVEDDGYSLEEAILVSGHETIAIPQRNYLAMKPQNFRLGPKARRMAVTTETLGTLGRFGQLEAATKEHPGPLPESLRGIRTGRHD